MGWKLSIEQRIRAGVALIIVFLLILATNMIDNHHFSVVQKSITSIYEDRLVAKNYIYRVSRLLEVKRNILQTGNWEAAADINRNANDSVKTLIEKYATTKLTETESRHFNSLKTTLNRLLQHEKNFGEGEFINDELHLMTTTDSYYADLFNDLDALSEIQIQEGKRELFFSNKAIDSSNYISKMEIGALLFIGVLLQLLIFLKPLK